MPKFNAYFKSQMSKYKNNYTSTLPKIPYSKLFMKQFIEINKFFRTLKLT